MTHSTYLLVVQGESGPSAVTDFWGLVEQAGPLRWPIFAVLAIGLALAIAKVYELLHDRSTSRSLFQIDLRHATLQQITGGLTGQDESMLAALQSAMLNVFNTRPTEGMLHDEIANFVAFKRDQFGVFRRRMEFLADTAGALGLMGTVWGMFAVFFQGTSDRDIILRGMGIALITTLLGLVASIILNLSATEVSTYFGKRLESVSRKADELRFRLLELAPAVGTAPARGVHAPARTPEPVVPTPPSARPPDTASMARSEPSYRLDAESSIATQAGETVAGITVLLSKNGGTPAAGVEVGLSVPPGAGTLGNGTRALKQQTDAKGKVRFDWKAPKHAGVFAMDAQVSDQPEVTRRIELQVRPAVPHRIEHHGNNQAAAAGMPLPKPFGVRVLDRFSNPIAGVTVTFSVDRGNGSFGKQGKTAAVETGLEGIASIPFAVSSEPGPNVVVVSMGGHDSVELVAFGTEL